MNFFLILGIILVIIALLWLALHMLSKGLRLVITSVVILLVLLFAGYVWWDYQQLQQGIASQPTFFVFADNGRLFAGFDVTQGLASPRQNLSIARAAYAADNFSQLRGDAYKLIIMGRESFPDVQAINVSGVMLGKNEVIEMLINGSVKSAFTARYARAHNTTLAALNTEKLVNDANMAGILFAALVSEQTTAGNIIRMTRDDKITIYPSTITLTLVRTIPEPLLPYLVSGGSSGP
jgi:hypothetical protein